MTGPVVFHTMPDGRVARLCQRCLMKILPNGQPDPAFYNEKFLKSFSAIPDILKCYHTKDGRKMKEYTKNVQGQISYAFPLDELLSPDALEILNKQGFVSFKIQDANGEHSTLGWFSRKQKTVIEKENIVINTSLSSF